MKSILLAAAVALALSVPAQAATYEDGAVALIIARQHCPGVTVTDLKLGTALFLASAEAGESDTDKTSLLLAARAAITAETLSKAGRMREFCKRIESISGE